MKIAMIGHKRIPSREGGIEIVVEELATRMVEKRHEVYVYNRRGQHVAGANNDSSVAKRKEFKGIHIISVPTPQKKSLNAIVYAFFATIHALFGRYDVIHYHAEGPCAMLWIPKMFGIRTVATIHGLDWQRSKWGRFATKFLKFGEKMAAKYADEIIVLSKSVQEYFELTYNRETTYIFNGISLREQKLPQIIRDKYGLTGNDYILFVARVVPEKGLQYLLEAYQKIETKKQLIIAGGSSHSEEYYEQMKNIAHQDSRIKMIGFVQGQELEELFSNCFAYVLPSDVEGMPISLLEAMSYGAHCLVSNIPENLQVIGDKGIIFEKGNVSDLKDKLEKIVVQDNKRTSESKQGIRDYVCERFDWNQVVAETLELYRKKES